MKNHQLFLTTLPKLLFQKNTPKERNAFLGYFRINLQDYFSLKIEMFNLNRQLPRIS